MVNGHDISEAGYRNALASRFLSAVSWSRMSRAEWAETVRRMENGSRFRFSYAPYQREPFDAMSDPGNSMVVLAWFSRGGKTEMVLNHIGYNIDQDPKRMIVAYPTASQSEDFSKDNLDKQLLGPTPRLNEILPSGGGRRIASNTIGSKSFPGGKIDIVGLNVAGKLRKLKASWLYADECDSVTDDNSDKGEGDKLAILWKRGSEYPDTTKILTSYPSLHGRSKIWDALELSDWRQWFVRHRCGHEYVMHRRDLQWDEGKPETARMICPGCSEAFDDDERRRMVMAGEWRATKPFTGVRGYQANGMLWPHPHQEAFRNFLHQTASEVEKATKSENPEASLRVIVNTFDAEPFKPKVETKPDPSAIRELSEAYDPAVVLPDGVLFLTAGIDVNKHFLAIEIVGFGENDETWGVHYEEIRGSWMDSATWGTLDAMIQKPWRHPRFGEMRPVQVMIDSKYQSNTVKRWAMNRTRRGVIPIVGSTTLGVPILRAKRRDPETGAEYWSLGTHEAKDMIYQRLELRPNGDGTFPQGYMHFPRAKEYDEDYFAGLLAEDSILKKADDGAWFRWFERRNASQRNEPLDVRCYAMAAAKLLNPAWAKLRENLEAKAAPKPEAKNPSPPKPRGGKFVGSFQ
jgi:phage terminase large subunit GpA-like protein